MRFGWKTRVGLVLSAVWLCLVFLIGDDDRRLGPVLVLGFLPLIILWGIVWAAAGWRAQRPTRAQVPEAMVLEAKRNRGRRLKTVLTVVAVLTIGLLTATWQFHAADNAAGANVISYWFGECLVYGLLAYGVLRLLPRTPLGVPAVLAAFVVVGGVNYKTYTTISEDRQARISLARATPFLTRIQSGAKVTDQEIKTARVGMLEPLLLAQAAFNRDMIAIGTTYSDAISSLRPELMLTPASLASATIREQSRAKLKLWRQATSGYNSQLDGAIARAKLGVQAAQFQMPNYMSAASKGFDESSTQLRAYMASFVTSETEACDAITAILDLMDANPNGYVVDKGPPANLLFGDQATLARFQQLSATIMAASQRETEARTSLAEAQSNRVNGLALLLKR